MLSSPPGSYPASPVAGRACRPVAARALLAFLAASLAFGCAAKPSPNSFSPVILDQAQLLDAATQERLLSHEYPPGFPFAFRTVADLPRGEEGAAANEWFERDLENHPDQAAFDDFGIYILASQNPPLVQVRVGDEFYLAALSRGITAGPEYLEHQQRASSGDISGATLAMTDFVSAAAPQAWLTYSKRRAAFAELAGTVAGEVEDLSLPSDSFYGRVLLRPILRLRALEVQAFGTYWMTFVVVGAAAFSFRKFITAYVFIPLLGRFSRSGAILAAGVTAAVVSAILSVPAAASIFVLGASRLEDQLALQAIGLSPLLGLALDPAHFLQRSSILLALIVGVARIAKGFASRSGILRLALRSSHEQQHIFDAASDKDPVFLLAATMASYSQETGDVPNLDTESRPFTQMYLRPAADDLFAAARWVVLAWVVLPRGLSIGICYIWVFPIVIGAVASVRGALSLRRSLRRPATAATATQQAPP